VVDGCDDLRVEVRLRRVDRLHPRRLEVTGRGAQVVQHSLVIGAIGLGHDATLYAVVELAGGVATIDVTGGAGGT
jgi:hypothetical protein